MSPRAHKMAAPWSPRRPLTSTASPARARSAPEIDAGADDADPGRGQEELVAGALVTTLVSPVTMATPASRAVAAIDAAIRRRRSIVSPSSTIDGAGEIERHRAADGEIVDRAAHREPADIAAGEDQRIDDEGIGGEGKPVAARARDRRDRAAPDRPAERAADCRTPRRTRRRSGPSSPCRRRHGRASRSAHGPGPASVREAGAATFIRRPS